MGMVTPSMIYTQAKFIPWASESVLVLTLSQVALVCGFADARSNHAVHARLFEMTILRLKQPNRTI